MIASLHNALSESHLEKLGQWTWIQHAQNLFVGFTLLARHHSTKHTAVVRKCCKAVSGLPHDACADVQSADELKVCVDKISIKSA